MTFGPSVYKLYDENSFLLFDWKKYGPNSNWFKKFHGKSSLSSPTIRSANIDYTERTGCSKDGYVKKNYKNSVIITILDNREVNLQEIANILKT